MTQQEDLPRVYSNYPDAKEAADVAGVIDAESLVIPGTDSTELHCIPQPVKPNMFS